MITKTNPVSIPAANCSGWWLKNIQIVAPSPTATASARVTMCPFDPATGIMASNADVSFVINDLLGTAMTDPTFGSAISAAIGALETGVQAYGQSNGLLT